MNKQQVNKPPINDETAELAIIGTLLVNNDFALRCDSLKHTHFYHPELAVIYKSMTTLLSKGVTSFDSVSILTTIEADKESKDTMIASGMNDLLSSLEDCKLVARSEYKEFELSMERVMTLSFKRKAKEKLNSLIKQCDKDDGIGLNEFNYKLQDEVTNIANEYVFGNDTPLLAETARATWEKIKANRTKNGLVGIPSKYISVNDYFTYRKEELVVIGGRAKSGKSIFVSNEVYHKAKNGVKVAIFDTELSDKIWLPRFLSEITGLTINQIESGYYNEEEEEKIENAISWIESGTLIHRYDPEWTMNKIYTRAKQIKIKHGLDMLVYDYIKADDVDLGGTSEHAYLGKLTSFLKNKIAGELDLAVIAPAQMNDNELRLADSRKIQRYASTICYWMEKDMDMIVNDGSEEGTHYLYVDFNRNGEHHKSDSKKMPVSYLNFVMDGNRATIKTAKKSKHLGNATPFDDK